MKLESRGGSEMTVTRSGKETGAVIFQYGNEAEVPHGFQIAAPIMLQIAGNEGESQWLSGGYSDIVREGDSLHCSGELKTYAGSVFRVADTYSPGADANSFKLSRKVSVAVAGPGDSGFLSRVSVDASDLPTLRDQELFIPGIFYRDSKSLPEYALGATASDKTILVREDRMPLPLVMLRNPRSNSVISLIHLDPDGSTSTRDNILDRVVDESIQVASLGVHLTTKTQLSFCYPATEGERTYYGRPFQPFKQPGPPFRRTVERFHPVMPGMSHEYSLMIVLSSQPDFPSAMRHVWRTAFDQIRPASTHADIAAAYDASIGLIKDWSRAPEGYPGLPFRLQLPQGRLEKPEMMFYQMGFVGQQVPLGYHLLRYGFERHDEEARRKGEAMVDFWAKNSLTPDGLPRGWFRIYPKPEWGFDNSTFLRGPSEGMVGALMAWSQMEREGRPKPEWLVFCRKFGDWLVKHQNPDGSWYRNYSWDNQPVEKGTDNTSHPIRFLVDLWRATGEQKYLDSALRAGDFGWAHEHVPFAYVGGTEDNPNVVDKEAGFMALEAYHALHDATGDSRWLTAAMQAADFTETWNYCWQIPIPEDDRSLTYPRGATSTGYSLIASGHSGADVFLAGAAFLYYRLYLKTGDPHYCKFAQQLLHDTKQSMDIGGSRGYGHPGLVHEALLLAPSRGHGVNTWLPWLTYSMIEPIVRLRDAYGLLDTPMVEGTELSELQRKDQAYGQSRGLRSGKR